MSKTFFYIGDCLLDDVFKNTTCLNFVFSMYMYCSCNDLAGYSEFYVFFQFLHFLEGSSFSIALERHLILRILELLPPLTALIANYTRSEKQPFVSICVHSRRVWISNS